MPYRWTHTKRLRRNGHGGTRDIEQGEVFEPTEAELAAFADRIEEVEDEEEADAEPDSTDAEAPSGDTEPPYTALLAEEHWQTVVSAIRDGEVDSVLDDLATVDDRPSVQRAIEERQAELEG